MVGSAVGLEGWNVGFALGKKVVGHADGLIVDGITVGKMEGLSVG